MSGSGESPFDAFLAHLRASRLLGVEELAEALKSFEMRRDGTDVGRLCDQLIANGALTQWQCGKLRDGRYKGFFLHEKFKILDFCTQHHYLAEELDTHRRVILAIWYNPEWPQSTEIRVVREVT